MEGVGGVADRRCGGRDSVASRLDLTHETGCLHGSRNPTGCGERWSSRPDKNGEMLEKEEDKRGGGG